MAPQQMEFGSRRKARRWKRKGVVDYEEEHLVANSMRECRKLREKRLSSFSTFPHHSHAAPRCFTSTLNFSNLRKQIFRLTPLLRRLLRRPPLERMSFSYYQNHFSLFCVLSVPKHLYNCEGEIIMMAYW
jgi:hypothetical protein